MADTSLLRPEIAEAIRELASPIQVRSPGYSGPGKVTSDPVVIVIDGAQGGFPVRTIERVAVTDPTATSHDFEVIPDLGDEEMIVRYLALRFVNTGAGAAILDPFRLEIRHSGEEPLAIVSASGREIAGGETKFVGSFAFELNGSGSGNPIVNLGQALPRDVRLSKGDSLHCVADVTVSCSVRVQALTETVPKGVYLAL